MNGKRNQASVKGRPIVKNCKRCGNPTTRPNRVFPACELRR